MDRRRPPASTAAVTGRIIW